MEAHLVECRECLTAYLALEREIETARASPAPSQATRERLRRAVAREIARHPDRSVEPGRWRRPLAFIFAAAASAAALLAVVSVRAQLQHMAHIASEPTAQVERRAPAGHESRDRLRRRRESRSSRPAPNHPHCRGRSLIGRRHRHSPMTSRCVNHAQCGIPKPLPGVDPFEEPVGAWRPPADEALEVPMVDLLHSKDPGEAALGGEPGRPSRIAPATGPTAFDPRRASRGARRAGLPGARTASRWTRPGPAACLPVFFLLALMAAAHFSVAPSAYDDPGWLVLLGGLVATSVGLAVFAVALRSYRTTGNLLILLIGCGVLIFGIGGLLPAAVRGLPDGMNANVALYAGAAAGGAFQFLAAFSLLAGASPQASPRRRAAWGLLGYAALALFMLGLAAACLQGALPRFFTQGGEPTSLRQHVLGAALLLLLCSLIISFGSYLRTRKAFLFWYACALALTCMSVSVFLIQRSVGSPVSWVGRLSQHVGGIYFLAALMAAGRQRASPGGALATALPGAEESFRALAENSPDAIRRFDRDLHLLYANPASRRLCGSAPQHAAGSGSQELPEGALRDALRAVFEAGEPVQVEEHLVVGTELRFFESRCTAEREPGGGVANVLVVTRDLSERKHMEDALRISTERMKAFVENMHAPTLLVGEDGGVVLANRAFCDSFGLSESPADLVGRRSVELIEKVRLSFWQREAPVARIQEIIRRGEPVFGEEVSLPNGRTCLRDFIPISVDGEPRGRLWQHVDITELKRAEEALREEGRRKNEFLAVLSHELRNPLAPIANCLHILGRAPPGSEQADRAQKILARQVGQLSSLVNDLLDVTRITRNKVHLSKEQIDLNQAVGRAVDDNRSLFERAKVKLELSEAPRPIPVDADRTRIAQVVGNLLNNSAKFTPEGGHARVSVAAEGAEAVVRVADDGAGVEPQTLARLFEPFTQADRTLDRSKGGLGLGLALVKGLVELHGGRVSAHSGGPGKGAEFAVHLPLALGAERAPALDPELAERPRRRVLIIEDNADAADSLRDALELRGHEVAVAYDGPDGLGKVRASRPEVVLCDIGLPGMSGFEVARAIRADEQLAGVSLVALTGYALPEDMRRASEAGFHHHVAKPPNLKALEGVLAEAPCGAELGPHPSSPQ